MRQLKREKMSFVFILTGDADALKPDSITLLDSFVDPVVIHHPKGHTIPRLGNFPNSRYL